MVNSGNLSLISNDSIKNHLLNIESLYKKMKSEEDHFRFDTETLIFKPLYVLLNINPIVNNYAYFASNGKAGKDQILTEAYFKAYLKSKELKNGFIMSVLEFGTMNDQMREMKRMSMELIELINREITK